MQESQNAYTGGMSYQQYQQQRFLQQQQQSAQAQQAIMSAGADSFSQKVMDTVNLLRQIAADVGNAGKQLEAQMAAQQRQIQMLQQNIENACAQLQNAFRVGQTGSTNVAGNAKSSLLQ